MDELDSITVARSWHDESYEKMWKSWFIMLLDLLKFGSDQYPQDIIPILFDPVHRVAKMFNSFLSKQVSYVFIFLINRLESRESYRFKDRVKTQTRPD